ncbi:MFS transporter [Nocardia terpenica]|uniref:MFS transporter n=1 Tax=Nocardia terpenica TaxID=455432 RepID=UPI001895377F|nr:MFS transporter [Nocardia terpenica]MBF6105968.1 MFS transporter [Nocardia terpenica]MBF6113447.1 MFS transporter [Nocardia terpenica]MBF6119709.1 MFS transporter [Nocardia terpenica]MBF6152120.1 MFS transporter [Nocardia terpenica]
MCVHKHQLSSRPETKEPPVSLFGNRDYRHLFTAQLSALFGTGLTTVALGLLSYRLAGADAGAVLGTALTVKMVAYVTVAPLAAAHAGRVPRRLMMVTLDVVRAAVVLALPFVDQVWQIYVLIAVLQSASAAFTPTFQAVLHDILPDERDYTAALSASQLAATMESLLSPMLAALLLGVVGFGWLFVGTSIGFLASAALVVTTRIPNATRTVRTRARDRTLAGLRIFRATPRLRGVLGVNLVVAAAGSVVMVNTVNYVRDRLGGSQADVAVLLAANGFGTMVVALALPRILGRVGERPILLSGAGTLLVGLAAAITLSHFTIGDRQWAAALAVWAIIGIGTGLALTPIGRVLRRSAQPSDRPALFAAQFSLSHLCWLIAYPIAGWLATAMGFTAAWVVLAALGLAGFATAVRCWPGRDPEILEHVHRGAVDPAHVRDAVSVGTGYRHAHAYVIDGDHRHWPAMV